MKLQKIVALATTLAGLLALLYGVSPAQGAPAQQANLLNNGSFEGGSYMYNNDGDMKYVPNAWTPWWLIVENKTNCNEALVKPHYEMEAHPTHVKDGMWSGRYWTDQRIEAGLYQTVAATPGTTYRFSIYGFSWVSNNGQVDDLSDGEQSMRIGIDPAGGASGNAASVVWSPEVWTNDKFVLLTVDAAATASKVTVFTRTKPNWCMTRNDSFWDAATLIVVGQGPTPVPAGGKTAVPAPTKSSSWGVQSGSIITATPQPDGSIVHTVSSGESCTGIAVAYNISLDELYSQNSLSNDSCRFISPGQQLKIRPPQQPTPAPPTATPDTTAVAEASSEVVAPPQEANGKICVEGFEDKNSNGLPEVVEPKLAGMTFEVSDGTQVIGTYTTDAVSEPYCFAEVPPGSYVVSWTGESLSPTNGQSWSTTLEPGGTVSHQFGAQPGGEAADGQTGSSSGPDQGGLPTWAMALLLAIGVMLLLSGVGVGGYFVLMRRTKI